MEEIHEIGWWSHVQRDIGTYVMVFVECETLDVWNCKKLLKQHLEFPKSDQKRKHVTIM